MAEYGIAGYKVTVTVDGGNATYKFIDPEDVTNVTEVGLSAKEIPAGQNADNRDMLDLAYGKAAKELNDKRDARIMKQDTEREAEAKHHDAKVRETAQAHLASVQDNVTQPVKTDKDGTNVYNTATTPENVEQDTKSHK